MTEKELMLTSLLHCRRIDLYVDKKPLPAQKQKRLSEMISRKEMGEPVQYITGSCEFMGVDLQVDKRALIPRPETELLVELAVEKLKYRKMRESLRILDIGTGCGNIAISLAKSNSSFFVTALDISAQALELAKDNARLNNVEEKINFIKSDLFSCFEKNLNGRILFDAIISNPPYIPASEISKLPLEVRHEPKIALDGGFDGLDFYKKIIKESPMYLRKGGCLFFEIGDGQRDSVNDIFLKSGRFVNIEFFKDYRQTDRMVTARLR